jgi:hypothetical protein
VLWRSFVTSPGGSRMAERTIEGALLDLADGIEWPTPVDFASRLRLEPLVGRTWLPRVAWMAGAIVVILSVVLIPSARQAVANLLEVAGIRIEFGETPDLPPPTILAPGDQVDMESASSAVDFPILTPSTLDPPTAVHLLQWELGTQVFLAWEASDRLPEVGESGTGLLLAEFRADLDEAFFSKIVAGGTTVDQVDVDGVPAFWLSGAPHAFMFETGRRDLVEDGTRLTGNVLVWERDGITYRLESSLDLEENLAIAESLQP